MFPEDRFLEILIIGALALIVIGPKDLPVLMRRIGQFVGKMRGMAAEFRASFDELARQSELDDLRREVEALRHTQDAAVVPMNAVGEPYMPPEPEPEPFEAAPAAVAPPPKSRSRPSAKAKPAAAPKPEAKTPAKPKAAAKPRAKAAKTAGEAS
jgi:sec-independent protein translocase protein TatB